MHGRRKGKERGKHSFNYFKKKVKKDTQTKFVIRYVQLISPSMFVKKVLLYYSCKHIHPYAIRPF